MFKNFGELCEILNYHGPAIAMVEELQKHLKTLYKWEFKTVNDYLELIAYERDFPDFIQRWREKICGSMQKFRNYYHTLTYEVPESIWRHGSAWKYSSDITETFVCLIKNHLLDYSTRGGFKQNPCLQIMYRLAVRSIAYTRGFGSESLIISPYEIARIAQIYANL